MGHFENKSRQKRVTSKNNPLRNDQKKTLLQIDRFKKGSVRNRSFEKCVSSEKAHLEEGSFRKRPNRN